MIWRPVVPIAIERDIPSQAAIEPYVISRVRVEKDTPWLRQRWEHRGSDVQIGFVESEELHLGGHHCGRDVWTGLRIRGLRIGCVLPS